MNKKNFTVSVAMAAYNGEDYIEAQIQSILSQLRPEDELVIFEKSVSFVPKDNVCKDPQLLNILYIYF